MMDITGLFHLVHPVMIDYSHRPSQQSGSEGSYDSGYKSEGLDVGGAFSQSGDVLKEKERSRDREKRRDRDRDRDRRRDHGDRDRSSDRHESESSSSSHYSMEKGGFSNLSGSGSSSGRSSPFRGSDDRAGEKWMTDTPTNTILLRGLPMTIDEKDIRGELMIFGVPIKEVRLMKNKTTGTSRGFAFVEFQSVEDSQRWMEQKKGKLLIQNQYPVGMYYSSPRGGEHSSLIRDHSQKTDWMCTKCGAHNFRRRDFCFKCNVSREESERTTSEDGVDQVGSNPCNTLILRGLDALTSEENIISALNTITALPIKNVYVVKDELTSTSKGYAFLEMNSLRESSQLLEMLSHRSSPLEVDGKAILVSYAKNTYSTVMATLSSQSQTQWPHSQSYDYSQYYSGGEYSYPGGYDQSQYYNQQGYDGYYYDQSYYQNTSPTSTAQTSHGTPQQSQASGGTKKKTQTDSTNAAAAVAQAAIQQAQAAKQYQKRQENMQKHVLHHMQHHQQKPTDMTQADRLAYDAQNWTQHDDGDMSQHYSVYPTPDVSTYQYDETSGYYYDPQTGLYYDANSQYYFNSESGQFLYWDSDRSTYLPAPTDGEDSTKDDPKSKKDGKDKKEKVKMAKKIAKDMEKWAKSLNAQKEAMKDIKKSVQAPTPPPVPGVVISLPDFPKKESAAADAGWAMLEKKPVEEKKLMPPPTFPGQIDGTKTQKSSALVASYGGDSDESDEDEEGGQNSEKHTDLKKLACLLCKRQFPTKEALVRHTQLSDLHKQNLEAAKAQSAERQAEGQQYRDRAKERREKFGIPAPPEPRKKQQFRQMTESIFEEPNKQGIQQSNIGNKMLQKMGWSQGQGLGKKGQGIVKPIEAKRRQMSAGLGMRGSSYNVAASDSYKDAVKKTMFARYHEGVE